MLSFNEGSTDRYPPSPILPLWAAAAAAASCLAVRPVRVLFRGGRVSHGSEVLSAKYRPLDLPADDAV